MRKGIKNIVLDMGNVIIRFDPDVFLDREKISDQSDRELLKKEIYASPMWIQMDMGELCEKQMIEIVNRKLPVRLRKHSEGLIAGWCDPLMPMEGMEELIFELKDRGFGIYLLSNASFMQKEYWPKLNCSDCFDGLVVSAFEHLMKPDERIYRLLLRRYGLKADECLFIDDRKDNVSAAEKLGMDVFHFEGDVGKLREYTGL